MFPPNQPKLLKRKDSPYYFFKIRFPDGTLSPLKTTKCKRKADAEKYRQAQIRELESQLPGERITVQNYSKDFFLPAGHWFQHKQSLGKNIGETYAIRTQAIIENHVWPRIGGMALADVDTMTVEKITIAMKQEKLSTSTINHALNSLKFVLERALKQYLIRGLPLFERPKTKKAPRGIFSLDEFKMLFQTVWIFNGQPHWVSFLGNLFAASCGLRLGEVLALKIGDVQETGKILINKTFEANLKFLKNRTKTGKSRIVFLPFFALEEYRHFIKYIHSDPRPENFIFESTQYDPAKRPVTGSPLRNGLYRAMEFYGIPKIRESGEICFHSHRHFFNSMLLAAKMPAETVRLLTGHSGEAMTENYFHIEAESEQTIKQTVNAVFSIENSSTIIKKLPKS